MSARTWPISRRRRLKFAPWSGGPPVLCTHAPPVVEEEDGRLMLRTSERHATEPFAFAAHDGEPWCAACGQPLQVFYWSAAADSWRAERPERSAASAHMRRHFASAETSTNTHPAQRKDTT